MIPISRFENLSRIGHLSVHLTFAPMTIAKLIKIDRWTNRQTHRQTDGKQLETDMHKCRGPRKDNWLELKMALYISCLCSNKYYIQISSSVRQSRERGGASRRRLKRPPVALTTIKQWENPAFTKLLPTNRPLVVVSGSYSCKSIVCMLKVWGYFCVCGCFGLCCWCLCACVR